MRTVKGTSQPLLYVYVTLNNMEIDATVDTCTTHNFVCHNTAARLGLCVGTHSSRVKAINSKAQAVVGRVLRVTIRVGAWNGKVDLLVVL